MDRYGDGVVVGRLSVNEKLRGYWDEKDGNGLLLSSSEYDALFRVKEGISYSYCNGELVEKSVYEGGVKRRVLLEWKNGKMVEYYLNGKRSYEGGWKGDVSKGFVREGSGTEFGVDGLSVVYKGDWLNGLRDGNGTWYRHGNGLPTYSGSWKKGYPNGVGSLKDGNGLELWDGDWENGYLNVGGNKWVDYEDGLVVRKSDKRRLRNWVLRGEESRQGVWRLCVGG